MNTPKINKIYLDMDGVICDFNKRFTELIGHGPRESDARKNFAVDFPKVIDMNIFYDLDPMADMNQLIGYLNSTGLPVEILSSTARESTYDAVSQQKARWLDKHNIFYPRIFVPGKQHKAKYANENSVIIDDTFAVIDAWNKAGGIGILHTDALTSISKMSTLLKP